MSKLTEPAFADDESSVMAKSFSVAPTAPLAEPEVPVDELLDPVAPDDEPFESSLLLEQAAPSSRSMKAGTAMYLRRTGFMRTPFGRRPHPGPAPGENLPTSA